MVDLRRRETFGETDPRKDMVGINVSSYFSCVNFWILHYIQICIARVYFGSQRFWKF